MISDKGPILDLIGFRRFAYHLLLSLIYYYPAIFNLFIPQSGKNDIYFTTLKQ